MIKNDNKKWKRKTLPNGWPKKKKAKRLRKLKIIKLVFINLMWAVCGGVLAYYSYLIATQFINAFHKPGNTITFIQNQTLTWPTATICNWNQNINGVVDLAPAYTNLTLVDCYDWASNGGSGGPCAEGLFTFQSINTTFGIFNCYVFNADINNPLNSSTTGFAGSLSTLFSIVSPPSNYDFRTGLQVTLDYIGTVPDLYNEIRFAPPGYDAFYGIQAIETSYNNNKTGPFYTYAASYSSTLLDENPPPNGTELVSVSFSFQTLNMLAIEYDTQYTIINLMGDFSGMIGVLMGMDLIKLTVSLPVCFAVCGEGEWTDVTEHFSG